MSTTVTIHDRVAAGAAFFDDRYPGWLNRIDLDALDVRSGYFCPRAQVLDTPWDYIHESSPMTFEDACGYGFDTVSPGEYPDLNAAWRELITARRGSTD